MRGPDEIRALLDALLGRAAGYDALATYEQQRTLATRFANNAVSQNTGGEEEKVRLVLARDGRQGAAVTNKLDADSLNRLAERAAAICADAAVDPEYMPPLPPQDYPAVPRRDFEDVAALAPADLADRVQSVCAPAAAEGFEASGLIEACRKRKAVANSAGLHAMDTHTTLSLGTTVHGPRGSGRAESVGETAAAVDAREVGGKALANAIAAQDPAPIEPGEYTVIMEPSAVWEFVGFLTANLDAREAAEGVSALSGSIGAKLFDERVNISLETDDADVPARPFGEGGVALRRTDWVNEGVLTRLSHGRYWAAQQGTEPDGDLFPFCMTGEDASLADLIAGCERGLLVKRLWYIRYVDRRELLLTGMTRDGLFLVEDGRIVRPVMNLRFNESPLKFLSNIVAMSRPERVLGWGAVKVPAVMSRGFTFSSKSASL